MKKLTRKSLDELAAVMPVISEKSEQRGYVGGTGTSIWNSSASGQDTVWTNTGSGFMNDSGYEIPNAPTGDITSSISASTGITTGKIIFNNPANSSFVSNCTINLLKSVFGSDSINITSVARTPEDQARIMYDNIVKNGVQEQLNTYKAPGDSVVNTYDPTKSRDENIAAMTTEINKQGPGNVSKHCANLSTLNVLDIAKSSIDGNIEQIKTTLSQMGIKVLDENGCLHLEIPQNDCP